MNEGDKVLIFTGRKITYVVGVYGSMLNLNRIIKIVELMMLQVIFRFVDFMYNRYMETGILQATVKFLWPLTCTLCIWVKCHKKLHCTCIHTYVRSTINVRIYLFILYLVHNMRYQPISHAATAHAHMCIAITFCSQWQNGEESFA